MSDDVERPVDGAGSRGDSGRQQRVGIALSGGGHRATAFGVGVLAAVVDADFHRRGSITNSAVAVAGDSTELNDVAELADWVAPTLRVVAIDGLFLPGAPTRGYVNRTLAALTMASCSVLALIVALAAGLASVMKLPVLRYLST